MIEMAVIALVVGVAAVAGVRHNLKSRLAWMKFAKEHDLTLESAKGAVPRLRGERLGFEIELRGLDAKEALVEIRDVDPWFTFRPGNGRGTEKALGDPSFDANVSVDGDRDFALSLLHDDVRRLVEAIVTDHSGMIKNGSLRAFVANLHQDPALLEPLLDLAEKLRRPSSNDVPPLLARNALEDPAPEFRRLAFCQLAKEFPNAAEARAVAETFLDADFPEHRWEAARYLLSHMPDGHEGATDELEALVELPKRGVSLRARSLGVLARFEKPDLAIRLATSILDGDEPWEMRLAAIDALVRTKALEELLEVRPTLEPNELVVLARGLGEIGDGRAQEALLSMLERPYEDLQIAAAQALGLVGNARAVPALRDAVAYYRDRLTYQSKDVTQAAEDAVARIQHRLGGEQGGELSITSVEPLQGAVSPVEEGEPPDIPEGGEVSLAG